MPSSALTVTARVCSRPLSASATPMTTSMGAISASYLPAARAAAARCWLCSP
jgi:hypothetical protein